MLQSAPSGHQTFLAFLPLPGRLGLRRILRELLDLQHTQLFRLIESYAGLFDPARKPLTFARDRSTSARKPGAVARKPKTPKCKVQSIEARGWRASHARVRPLRASPNPPSATPALLRLRLRPSPRQGCEACTPGVEVCAQGRRVCAQGFRGCAQG
jgi:hypothetical protein